MPQVHGIKDGDVHGGVLQPRKSTAGGRRPGQVGVGRGQSHLYVWEACGANLQYVHQHDAGYLRWLLRREVVSATGKAVLEDALQATFPIRSE